MNKRILAIVLTVALLVGAVGVTGIVNAGATVADCVTGATLTELTAQNLPTGTNLLSGLVDAKLTDGVYQGINWFAGYKKSGGEYLYTGSASDADTKRWIQSNVDDTRAVFFVNSEAGAAVPYVDVMIDLGAKKKIGSFVVGNTAEIAMPTKAVVESQIQAGTWNENPTKIEKYVMLHQGEFYAANDPITLYTSGPKASWDYLAGGLTPSNSLAPVAGQYSFDEALTAQFVGFRFYVNSAWGWASRIRVSELGLFSGAAGEGTTYVPLTEENMPAKKNLLTDAKLTDEDGFPISFSSGNRARITDGHWQGLDEKSNYEIVNYTTSYNGKTSDPYPGQPGKYFKYSAWGWCTTDVEVTRSVVTYEGVSNGDMKTFMFDIGQSTAVEAIALGSSAEPLTWAMGNAPTDEATLATKLTTYDSSVMFYKAQVYIGDDAETILDGENLAFEYDFTSHKADGFRNLWTLSQPMSGRYVAICLPVYSSRIRISELAAYSGEKIAKKTKVTADNIPNKKNLLTNAKLRDEDGFPISFSTGTRDRITDGKWQGIHEPINYQIVNYATTYNGKTAEPYPGQPGKYFKYSAWGWCSTDVEDTRSVLRYEGATNGDLKPLVFDLGKSMDIESIGLGSTAEPNTWAMGNAPSDEAALAAKLTDYNSSVVFYKGKVYIGDDPETLLDDANLVIDYDYSSNKMEGFQNLWELAKVTRGRYVAICLPVYGSLIRISELAAYGVEKIASRTALTADTLPEGVNFLHNLNPTDEKGVAWPINAGKMNYLADGGWQGFNVPVEIMTSDTQKTYAGKPAEAVPGKTGEYFVYNDIQWSKDTTDLSRVCYLTNYKNGELTPITFDLGSAQTIDTIAIGSSVERGCWQIGKAPTDVETLDQKNAYINPEIMLFKGEVYIGDSLETLYDEANRVVDYDMTESKLAAQANLWTLPEAVEGRYVGFMLPSYSSRVRIGELGVYNSQANDRVLPYGTFDNATAMGEFTQTGENLLLGTKIENNQRPYLIPNGLFFDAGDYSYLTDGYVNFDGKQEQSVETTLDGDSSFYYDLCGEAELDGLLFANAYGKHLAAINVYVGNDLDTLFNGANEAGVAYLGDGVTGAYIDLRKATGRYVGFMLTGDEAGKAYLAELGLYGSYTGTPDRMDDSLVQGLIPWFGCEVYARGIDNKTAVDSKGNPGQGNTGELSIRKNYIDGADLKLLTDGDVNTRSSRAVGYPDHWSYDMQGVTSYDRPWVLLAYYLGGEATVNDLTLFSSSEYEYHVSGVQYYASYLYEDLFKNESLLYTSGGEYYTEKNGEFMPDLNYEMNTKQAISYRLTEEQKAKKVRYVAFVITRPYGYYFRSWPTVQCKGWGSTRTSEFTVNGTYIQDDDLPTTYTTQFEGKTVTVNLNPASFDDWDMFNNIAGVKVTREPIPAGVNTTTDKGWLTAEDNTMLHVQLVDKDGNAIPDTGKGGLNGTEISVSIAAAGDHTQTMGIIEDGKLRRIYNAYSDPVTGLLTAGSINYPRYQKIPGNPYSGTNNRDKAVIKSADVYLVVMRYNDLDTIDSVNGRKVNPSLSEFMAKR